MVIAFFDTGSAKDLDKTVVYFHAETPGGQGLQETKTFSSFFAKKVDTIFKSVDSSDKVKLTNNGTELEARALIDFNKAKNYEDLKLVAVVLDIYPRLEIIDVDVETANTQTVTFGVSTALVRFYTVNGGGAITIGGTSFNENFTANINENIIIYHNGIEDYATPGELKYTKLDLTKSNSLKTVSIAGEVACEYEYPPLSKNIIEELTIGNLTHNQITIIATNYLKRLSLGGNATFMNLYFEDNNYPEVTYLKTAYSLFNKTIHNFKPANFPKLEELLLSNDGVDNYVNSNLDFSQNDFLKFVFIYEESTKTILNLDHSTVLEEVHIRGFDNDFNLSNSQNLTAIEIYTTLTNTQTSINLGGINNLEQIALNNFPSVTNLNLSGYTSLWYVWLQGFNSLGNTLTLVSSIEELYLVNFGNNNYTFANLSGQTAMRILNMVGTTAITTFNTPPNLEIFRFDSNVYVSGLDVSSSVTTMKWVYINTKSTSGIVYSDTECFYLDNNDVDITTTVDLSDFTNLNLFYQKNTSLIDLDVSGTIGFGTKVSNITLRPTAGSELATDADKVSEIIVSLAATVTEIGWADYTDFYNVVMPTLGVIDLTGNCASPNTGYTGFTAATNYLVNTLGFTILTN